MPLLLLLLLLSGCGTVNPATSRPTTAHALSVTALPTPRLDENRQIVVVAPTANASSFKGTFFYVKENNLWQSNGVISNERLGGVALTKSATLDFVKNPAVSPDGTLLAYAYSPEPTLDATGRAAISQQIILLDLKSKQTKQTIKPTQTDALLDEPAWSKDGAFLYYSFRQPLRDKQGVVTGQKLGIRRYEMATGKDEAIIEDATAPVATPDGKGLVFVALDATNQTFETSLKMLDLASRKTRDIISPEQSFLAYYFPRLSPDGQSLVFSAPSSTNIVPLIAPTAKTGLEGSVHIFSTLKHSIPYDLWVIKLDGTGLRRLTALYEDQPMGVWSKDARQIIFLAGHGLYTVDLANGTLTKKSDEGAYSGFDYRE